MKALFEKISSHIVAVVFAGIIAAVGFYYTAKLDIINLKEKSVEHTKQITELDKRMNEKDVQYREIIIRQDYTIQMLEEMRKEIKEASK